MGALRRLDNQARRLEGEATGPDVATLLAQEPTLSHGYGYGYGGRGVFGWEEPTEVADDAEPRRA